MGTGVLTVAHNCHGKTKSHGTTNFTHGKTMLSDGKTKLTHGRTPLIHGKTKLTHGKTKLNSRQNKENELVSGCALEMVLRVTVTNYSLRKPPFLVQCPFRAHDVLQRLWFASRSKCQYFCTLTF